jgi:predicted DNA-binding protein (MmcQ/YjbR family)
MRRRCLALPEVSEKIAWGHPSFRVSKHMFCAFEMIKGRPSIAFRLPRETCDDLRERDLAFITPYGRGLWASVWVDVTVDQTLLETLLQASYREVASKKLLALLDAPAGSRRPAVARQPRS